MGKTTIINMKGIPKSTWKKFKAMCAEKDMTATQGFIDLMRAAVEPEPPEPPEEADQPTT